MLRLRCELRCLYVVIVFVREMNEAEVKNVQVHCIFYS